MLTRMKGDEKGIHSHEAKEEEECMQNVVVQVYNYYCDLRLSGKQKNRKGKVSLLNLINTYFNVSDCYDHLRKWLHQIVHAHDKQLFSS